MRRGGGAGSVRPVCLAVMLALFALSLPTLPRVAALSTHLPILIDGDSGFTASNGVVGGSGQPSDPYVIEGWDINASTAHGIIVRNTTAAFVLRNLVVHSGFYPPSWDFDGISLTNVARGGIENATLRGNFRGVSIRDSANVTILRNTIYSNNADGISILYSRDIRIDENDIFSNGYDGIYTYDSEGFSLSGNRISSQAFNGFGIDLVQTLNASIEGNVLRSAGLYLEGNLLPFYTSHTVAPNNTVNGRPLVFHKDCSGVTVDGASLGQLFVMNCTAARVSNLVVSDTNVAVEMAYVKDVEVTGNRVFDVQYGAVFHMAGEDVVVAGNAIEARWAGIVMWSASNPPDGSRIMDVAIRDNNLTGWGYGIEVLSVRQNLTIEGNRVDSSWQNGIYLLGDVADARVLSNTLTNGGGSAIWVGGSRDIVVGGNRAAGSWDVGIRVRWSSRVAVYGNTMEDIGDPALGYGDAVRVDSSSYVSVLSNNLSRSYRGIALSGSSSDLLHHNCVVDNGAQATETGGKGNRWDDGYPGGGNYWSDYTGADAYWGPGQNLSGPDGIGDTPYSIGGGGMDRYPLLACVAADTPPVASFLATPPEGDSRTTFAFDASRSWDLETPGALEFRWDWEDDGVWDTVFSSSRVATHVYAAAGDYAVRLEVRDLRGLVNGTTRIVTVQSAPEIRPDFAIVAPEPTSPIRAGLSRPVHLALRVRNVGNASAPAGASLVFFDEATPGTPFRNESIPALAPGETSDSLSVTWTAPAVPGTHRLVAQADPEDGVSEWDESNNRFTWTVTAVAGPTTSLVLGEPNYTGGIPYITSHTPTSLNALDVGGTGIRRTMYRIDGGPWVNFTALGPFVFTREGSHLLEWFSEDNAGNVELVDSAVVGVDDTPPLTRITPGPGRYVEEGAFVLEATDGGSGVRGMEFQLDGAPWAPYSGPIRLGIGRHTITYRSVDNLGNEEGERTASVDVVSSIAPNHKPLVALVFGVVLALAGVWSTKRRGGLARGNRAWLVQCAAFPAAEFLSGVVSSLTGLLSVPPIVGLGMLVDTGILAAGLLFIGIGTVKRERLR